MNRETAVPSVTSVPGPKARERVAYHSSHAATTTYVYDFVWDVNAPAVGPFCTDADGNVLLDFTSHVGAAPLGYNNPELLARMEAFDVVDPLKIAGQDFYTTVGDPTEPEAPGPAELMDLLTEISSPYGLDTVFLSNSGAEAVENAIKICYDESENRHAITFEGAFHGRTLGALSLNRSKGVHRRQYPDVGGIEAVPYCRDIDCNPSSCSCGFFTEDGSILERMLDPDSGYLDPDELAYIIFEPIQGEGGYYPPSKSFVQELRDICEQHNLLLISDEIQSGLGRTGEWWGVDHYPIEPDVICAGKGVRTGATIADRSTFPDDRARISSTWGAGGIVDAMQGALTIELIDDLDLLQNATKRGVQILDELQDASISGVVDYRGKGLMVALEFESSSRRDAIQEAALQRGLLTVGCGHKALRLLPPLDVREREISIAVDILEDAATTTS